MPSSAALPFRRVLRAIVFALALLCACTAVHARDLRVMSFNVGLLVEADGENRWEARRTLMIETIRRAHPDLVGTQELFGLQGDALVAGLRGYRWFGRGRRGGGTDDEHMGVLYRVDALRLVDSGDFWFSDTPDVVGSISWGNLYPRMVTWGLFETRDGARFYLLNTHFPYRDEDEAVRVRCAQALLDRIRALPQDVPVVVTGDFNTGDDSAAHALLTRDLRDAWQTTPHRSGPEGTFHAFTGEPQRRIDWILLRGYEARSVETMTVHRGTHYPSDHFPVLAVLRRSAPASAKGVFADQCGCNLAFSGSGGRKLAMILSLR